MMAGTVAVAVASGAEVGAAVGAKVIAAVTASVDVVVAGIERKLQAMRSTNPMSRYFFILFSTDRC